MSPSFPDHIDVQSVVIRHLPAGGHAGSGSRPWRGLALAIVVALGMVACTHPDATQQVTPGPADAAEAMPLSIGIPVFNPRPGLYTAGQPAADDWAVIAAHGITTVINLRPPAEMGGRDEASEVRAAGMAYVEIPVAGGQDISADNARRLHEALQAANGPVLLHCASANRVGGLLAVSAARHEGLSLEDALKLGRDAGMRSTETAARARLAEDCPHC